MLHTGATDSQSPEKTVSVWATKTHTAQSSAPLHNIALSQKSKIILDIFL